MPERPFTDSELEAAVMALSDPERFSEAKAVVEHAAPQLERLLGLALTEGGWLDDSHESAISGAALREDPGERVTAVRTLMTEEARAGMMVGVAVGYELARELLNNDEEGDT